MKNVFLFVLLSSFWGGSFVAIKYVVNGGIPPVSGAFARVGVAFVFLVIVTRVLGKSFRLEPGVRRKVWLTGLFAQGIPFALLFWGEKSISAGLAGILNGTVPILTIVFAVVFLRDLESVTPRKVVGLAMGLIGIGTIFYPVIHFRGNPDEIYGAIAVFGMSVSYGIGTTLNRRLLAGRAKVDFYGNLIHQHIASLAFLIGTVLILEAPNSTDTFQPNISALLSILYLGILSTGVAFIVFYHLIREWGAIRASTVTYLVPIFGLAFDYLFFRNTPDRFEVIGITAVFLAIFLIQSEHFLFRSRRRQASAGVAQERRV